MACSNDSEIYACGDITMLEYTTRRNSLINKEQTKYRLIDAVVRNRVGVLEELLTSPEWYQVTDADGNNLLQIAAITNNKDVFDHLLALKEEFPMDAVNKDGRTALYWSLTVRSLGGYGYRTDEYFALRLLDKGAALYETALHDACRSNFLKVSQLLLEKGVDPNARDRYGNTALYDALNNRSRSCDLEGLLLAYGVDPLVENGKGSSAFDIALHDWWKDGILDHLIDYTVDDDSQLKLRLSTLMKLGEESKAPFFHKIIGKVVEVAVDEYVLCDYHNKILRIDKGCLRILVENCGFLLIPIVLASSKIFTRFSISRGTSLDAFSDFIEDTFDCRMADFAWRVNSTELLGALLHADFDESVVTEIFLFLASYGLTLKEDAFQLVYTRFGYCDLFRIMLHMDYKMACRKYQPFTRHRSIMPMLLYDIQKDPHTYLQQSRLLLECNVHHLLDHFCHPRLKKACMDSGDEMIKAKVMRQPRIPLLRQLARDVFRKFLIDGFRITAVRHFLTAVNHLDINNHYKKIITLETKLY